ncbi:MAG: hypothetical protein AVDCRST_MAG86-791, partial [uncultured Truepera sp.]
GGDLSGGRVVLRGAYLTSAPRARFQAWALGARGAGAL